jgi:uncharacterized membrane protein YjjP (DUF1212 family)
MAELDQNSGAALPISKRRSVRPIRLLLILALVLAGVLSGFYVWGEWVAGLVMIAFAGRAAFLLQRDSKQQPVSPPRLVINFIGNFMAAALAVFIGYVVGMLMHGGAPN